ncbi:Protein PELOTA 2 [Raphanus sativus]|uniref:Protein pelota homolog n=1 Tax=Raphanus sativus TaxID=3726 RepID=A0A6J0KR64_RAPSA|nr:protein PELOTA 2-like [Raphanus sativus]KAJ4881300.1 Protein PELOTA 2 [Raphanus sativus]
MKVLRRDFVRDGPGSVKLMAEDSDDLWFTYNLISPGDSVMAITSRKVLKERGNSERIVSKRIDSERVDSERVDSKREDSDSDSDSDSDQRVDPKRVCAKKRLDIKRLHAKFDDSKPLVSERLTLKLEVQVEEVTYDKEGDVLRILGTNILENEHVPLGAYQSLELMLKRRFLLRKQIWDSLAIDTLNQAKHHKSSVNLAVVLMQEGHAQIFLVGKSVGPPIETSIPNRKHAGYESALKKFFENVVRAFVKHVDFSIVRCVVIASPGFTKDQFHRHLLSEAERRKLRDITENKSRILLVHANSGYRHSLGEVLSDPKVMKMIQDTKASKEVNALRDFFTMFAKDPYRACYGPKHVEFAHQQKAIQTLLITDELFKNSDVKKRKKYVDFVESVKQLGGEAFIFSSMHVSGEQLAKHTRIAALLRFPLPDLDDVEM